MQPPLSACLYLWGLQAGWLASPGTPSELGVQGLEAALALPVAHFPPPDAGPFGFSYICSLCEGWA